MTLNRRVLKRVHSPLKSPKRLNSSMRKKALIKQLSGEVQFGAASKANVKVVVRIRPHNERELENCDRSVVKTVDSHMMIFDPKDEEDDFFFKGVRQRTRDLNKRQHKEQKFMFERIFDVDSTNEQIFEETTKDIVDTVLSGYNCSVFAYGATGAGKTFTMLGKPECPGITFLTLMELYRRIEELKEEKTCEVGISYLEVYNETVRDLLQPGKLLNIQESGSQVLVPGLSLHKPENAEELMKMLAFGNQNRTQHPTDANAESSRSHAVFQIFVRQQARTANLKSNICIAKLSMIDLAGSERGAATGFKGARFREGANINKSLLALGNCINALADGLRHVPYRDSKLTRLLKDSLGGNCRSVMIAAVSPAATSFEETFNTLRYANRAKTIKTTLKKNLMNVDQHVTQYVKIVENLREEICSLKEKIKVYEEKEAEWESGKAAIQLANEAIEKQDEGLKRIASLEQQLQERATELHLSSNFVSEEETAVQKKLEDVSKERKALRRELLQLEVSQRELNLKIHNCNLRLQRMKIVSFASQKLDKSISKCERTTRHLSCKLEQTKKLQQTVMLKLDANLLKLNGIQLELHQWGLNGCQPSQATKLLLEKNESALAEQELQQHIEFLRGLAKETLTERGSSEQFICQLLGVVRNFYVHMRANHVCSPDMEKQFESVIDCMDESKILWADQQGNEKCDNHSASSNSAQSALNISELTLLPITPNVFLSPTIPQENVIYRRSIMKSADYGDLDLKKTQLNCDFEKTDLTDIMETSQNVNNVFYNTKSPESPVLSTNSWSDDKLAFKPSPVIGSTHLPARTFAHLNLYPVQIENRDIHPHNLAVSSGNSDAKHTMKASSVIFDTKAPSTNGIGHNIDADAHKSASLYSAVECNNTKISPVISQGQNQQAHPNNLSFTSASMTKGSHDFPVPLKCQKAVRDTLNGTELLEDIQPLECSLSDTFSTTPGKCLNVTMDLPVECSVNSTFSTTGKSLNVTMDLPSRSHAAVDVGSKDSHGYNAAMLSSTSKMTARSQEWRSSCMNTTVDLTDQHAGSSKAAASFISKSVGCGDNYPTAFENRKSMSWKLSELPDLDATYNLNHSESDDCSLASPLENKSEPVVEGAAISKAPQRQPLISVENKSQHQKATLSRVIANDSQMPPPSSVKKGILKKTGITPHKTPGKSITPFKSTGTLSAKKSSGGLRRSLSTSALTTCQPTNHSVSPVLKRKSNGLSSAIRRTTSFLKTNRYAVKNQENKPPGAQKTLSHCFSSITSGSSASSVKKYASQALPKT